MKKFAVSLIAISLCFLFAGTAWASKPQMENIDRHATWTNWYDENGKRVPAWNLKSSKRMETPQKPQVSQGQNEAREFPFIRETRSYDYSKDHKPSS